MTNSGVWFEDHTCPTCRKEVETGGVWVNAVVNNGRMTAGLLYHTACYGWDKIESSLAAHRTDTPPH